MRFFSANSRATLAILTLFFSLFFFQKINLAASDLGRHITNGRLLMSNPELLSTNFYSYTQPIFVVINHHWFFGVIVAFLEKLGGFGLLTLFGASLASTSFSIMTITAYKQAEKQKTKYSLVVTLIASLVALPLITSRTEVRPELVSLLLVAIFYSVLKNYTNQQISLKKTFLILLPLQILWVNTHLFFILGIGITGVFGVTGFLSKKLNQLKQLTTLVLGLTAASLLNPAGIRGLLQPLSIFNNYGYLVAENQSVLFFLKRAPQVIHAYTFIILIILLLFTLTQRKKHTKLQTPEFLLVVIFGLASLKITRLLSFFGLILIPFLTDQLLFLIQNKYKYLANLTNKPIFITATSLTGFTLIGIILGSGLFIPKLNTLGFGLYPGVNYSAKFFIENNLPKPIFNNYDIGGYLIYHLTNGENHPVYTDNRPEAYPADFFDKNYIKPQEDAQSWKALQKKHNFQTIIFYRHDMTPWGQEFMISRVEDVDWTPVFVDNYALILLKNNKANKQLIERFELPKEMFGATTPKLPLDPAQHN